MAVFSKTSTHICLLSPLKIFSVFIYSFWLPWVSFAARGLCLVAASRVYSLCCARSSLQGLVLLQSMALGTPAQSLWHVGFLAPLHVESSWTRTGTCVPCIGR